MSEERLASPWLYASKEQACAGRGMLRNTLRTTDASQARYKICIRLDLLTRPGRDNNRKLDRLHRRDA